MPILEMQVHANEDEAVEVYYITESGKEEKVSMMNGDTMRAGFVNGANFRVQRKKIPEA